MTQDATGKKQGKPRIAQARAEIQAHLRAEQKRRRLIRRFRADAAAIVIAGLVDEQAARRARGQEPLFAFCHLSGVDWAQFRLSARPGTEPHIEIILTNREISVKAVGWPIDPELSPSPTTPVHVRIPLVQTGMAAPTAPETWIPRFRDALARSVAELRL